MPYEDGTGPDGMGPMTGRGLGPCARGFRRGRGQEMNQGFGRGRGRGMGRGFGRGMGRGFGRQMLWNPINDYAESSMTDKEMFEQEAKAIENEQKALKEELDYVKKKLKELKK